MIEKIDKNNDEEKVLEEFENMNLEERIKDQKDFLRMYLSSDAYASSLKNELFTYSILRKRGVTAGEVQVMKPNGDLPEEERRLFDFIKKTKITRSEKTNIKTIKIENSEYGGLTAYNQKGSDRTINMKGGESDPFVLEVNKLMDKGEVKDFDIVLNDIDNASMTSPIHEMYHSIDDRSIGLNSNTTTGIYLERITRYFQDTAKISLSGKFKKDWLEYIFKLEEVRSLIIEIKYIMYKLKIRDVKEEINNTHIDKMIKLVSKSKYPKVVKSLSELLNRIQIISGGYYNYEDMKNSASIQTLEYIKEVEAGSRLLLKTLMNNIGSNDANNKVKKDQIHTG